MENQKNLEVSNPEQKENNLEHPYLEDQTAVGLKEAREWRFNKGWDTYGISMVEDSGEAISKYVNKQLKRIYDKLKDEVRTVRINVMLVRNDGHKMLPAFMLADYASMDIIAMSQNVLESYVSGDGSLGTTGDVKVLVIGKRNSGRTYIPLENKLKIAQSPKF